MGVSYHLTGVNNFRPTQKRIDFVLDLNKIVSNIKFDSVIELTTSWLTHID